MKPGTSFGQGPVGRGDHAKKKAHRPQVGGNIFTPPNAMGKVVRGEGRGGFLRKKRKKARVTTGNRGFGRQRETRPATRARSHLV